jgi:methionyl-tRNA formyltransferase
MNQAKINFVFFGTPDVASETLEILKDAGFLPSLIVTSPDAKSGRKMLLTPPPVKTWAIENNIPYIQPKKLDEMNLPEADLFIVVAYGKIIPQKVLDLPKFGSLNIHYSLLPKYRGASPVESSILNGDKETGVSMQKMIFKLDAGDVVAQEKTNIIPDETAPELRKRLIKQGGELLIKTLPDFIDGKIQPIPQNEAEATHCGKIKKEDGLIDLKADAVENYNKFRAYAAWPRTFFFKDDKRIIIIKARLENGNFIIEKVIPEGGKEMEYKTNI